MSYTFCHLCREQYPSNEMKNELCFNCQTQVCNTCGENYIPIPYFSYEAECDSCSRTAIANFLGVK
jgi:hypothetical protein